MFITHTAPHKISLSQEFYETRTQLTLKPRKIYNSNFSQNKKKCYTFLESAINLVNSIHKVLEQAV